MIDGLITIGAFLLVCLILNWLVILFYGDHDHFADALAARLQALAKSLKGDSNDDH